MVDEIIILCSSTNIGDQDTKKLIIEALAKKITFSTIYEIDTNKEFSKILLDYKQLPNKKFILSFGEKSLDFLEYLNHEHLLSYSSYIGASIHQYDYNVAKLPLSYLCIPNIVIDSEDKKSVIDKIPKSTLVSSMPTNNPSIEKLQAAYESWEIKDKPILDNNYIIVMLPGDAPDQNSNKINYFTTDSAKLLFEDLQSLWKKLGSHYKILVHNGPRTGKYDQKTGKEICKHESETDIDLISQYFINLLESSEIEFSFFNFYKSNNITYSVFNPLLYIAQLRSNYFIVPAESVSMLGQIPLYIDPTKAIAFKSSSMNPEHQLVLKYSIEQNHISYFEDSSKEIIIPSLPKKISKQQLEENLNHIVHDIVESYNNILGDCPNHQEIESETHNS